MLKSSPTIILRPAIGVTKAVGTALLGVGNTLDKTNKRRIEDVSVGFAVLNNANMTPEVQTTLSSIEYRREDQEKDCLVCQTKIRTLRSFEHREFVDLRTMAD